MTLQLCTLGSLMDLLRARRRFTEPESRFFMIQLIGACHYMHAHQVIHRDLKLGNLFLDSNMNIKVGDFGLAALIESPGERKKTICGTPNYIAPEVLFDTANGHSFEVDIWSIGVILYTFIIGRPPFQTKDVKAIYKYAQLFPHLLHLLTFSQGAYVTTNTTFHVADSSLAPPSYLSNRSSLPTHPHVRPFMRSWTTFSLSRVQCHPTSLPLHMTLPQIFRTSPKQPLMRI